MKPEIRTCKFCGKEFETRAYNAKYCSKSCKGKQYHGSTIHDVTCPVCGTVFQTSNSKSKFCSQACYAQSLRIYKPVRTCAICGIELTPLTKALNFRGVQGKLCNSCREERKAQSKGFAVCIVCGKAFRSRLPRKTCTDECLRKFRGVADIFAGREKLSVDEKIALVQDDWSNPFPVADDNSVYGNMINL